MRRIDQRILFSPSDLTTFMESPFASAMNRKRLFDPTLAEQMDPEDSLLVHLRKKGYDHEGEFVQFLKSDRGDLVEIADGSPETMRAATFDAMRAGKAVITQAYLQKDNFAGKADFLMRVDGRSELGDYHYEVWDTKLSKKLKPYFAIQLCCYAEMLETLQGRLPEKVSVVLGNGDIKPLRIASYYSYYRSLKTAFLDFHANPNAPTPDPALSSSHGDWSELAKRLLEERDHLSGVANLRRSQILKLEAAGIETKSALAETDLIEILSMNADVLGRAKIQARLQISSGKKEKPDFEILSHPAGMARGLALLPPESPSDVFFDIEGFPGLEGGLEYLWGNTYFEEDGTRAFKDFWAHNKAEEKRAFVDFIDWVYGRWLNDPKMHTFSLCQL